MKRLPALILLAGTSVLPLLCAGTGYSGPLIYWKFDEGAGSLTRDHSGHGLDGKVGAAWTISPSGRGLLFDGTSSSTVGVSLPEDRRFGKNSWTFTAWLKPLQLGIDSSQNQRVIFSSGRFPDAVLVINLHGNGRLSSYFCYRDRDGKVISTEKISSSGLVAGEWAHVALVVDRGNNRMEFYVDGIGEGPAEMRPGFDGDFTFGNLTVGGTWQNYWGLMDEVKIFPRALSGSEVRAEFQRLRRTFRLPGPSVNLVSDEYLAAARRESAGTSLLQYIFRWGDFKTARGECARIIGNAGLPMHIRSYAAMRLAQSYLAEGNLAVAKDAYGKIRRVADFPETHRFEAGEMSEEIARMQRGLPPREPAARRRHIEPVDSFAAKIHVAPHGDDAGGDGSKARPFASLKRARDEVRAVKSRGEGAGAIGVLIAPGEYQMTESLRLTVADSGSERAPVVYRADVMGEAVLYGGRRLTGFKPVDDPGILARLPEEARGRVFQSGLKALGIDDYGELKVRGYSHTGRLRSPLTLELYFEGEPMPLARWPNEGFVGIRELVNPGIRHRGDPAVLGYESDRHARWLEAEDLWLFGYFHRLWADSTIRIGAIDPGARTISTAEPFSYRHQGMCDEQGIIYYAFNLLEEIDIPGEWYLDRETGVLYFYPPSDPAAASIEIGMLSEPMLLMDDVSHVRFEGVVFDLARGDGIRVTDSSNILFAGCTVRRMAGNGIMVHGGRGNGIFGCDIYHIGRRATEVIGGDRRTLAPGGHFVENCRIHSFGRIDRTYTPAVQLEGVGNRVAHNLMYDAPSSVMRLEGNDHVFEFNEVHSAVTESDDQGAIDMYSNPAYRGNIFRYNYFRDIGKTGDEPSRFGQAAIRLDAVISGQVVYGNIFVRSSNNKFGAVHITSGRDNIIDNNIFYHNKHGITGGYYADSSIWREMRAGTHRHVSDYHNSELYLSRYPELVHMLDGSGVNYLLRNVFYGCGRMELTRPCVYVANRESDIEDDSCLVDAPGGDFRLKPDSLLFKTIGFRSIPADEIGLYEDEFRASSPDAK